MNSFLLFSKSSDQLLLLLLFYYSPFNRGLTFLIYISMLRHKLRYSILGWSWCFCLVVATCFESSVWIYVIIVSRFKVFITSTIADMTDFILHDIILVNNIRLSTFTIKRTTLFISTIAFQSTFLFIIFCNYVVQYS